jgi:hypothetical protein
LVVVPWSPFWERNWFFRSAEWIADAGQSGYARGAISGVGVLMLLYGLVELAGWIASRYHRQT